MSGYIGNIPVPQATQTRESFTATASQTTFNTAGYTPNFLDVFLNGVHLLNGTDYTATNGSDVVLTSGATAGDTVEVLSYSTFEVADRNFTGDTSAENFTVTGTFTSRGIDDNATSTAVTLDASGNVLVGTTSTTPAVSNDSDGIALQANGTVQFSANATTTAIINRKATDGAILQFRKDGTTVGSIGNRFGAMYVHSPDGANGSGLRFYNGTIQPCESNGNDSDNDTNLGQSNSRFKDLYLSGGVYLGGTGAANHLDDYEEGTYTPSITGGQVTLNTGMNELFYTKVGRLVTVTGRIRILSIINSTGNLSISLPFTSASSSTNGGYASFQIITYNITLVTGTVSTFGELGNSSSLIGVSCQRDNNTWAAIPLTSLAGGDYIHVSGSYQTD